MTTNDNKIRPIKETRLGLSFFRAPLYLYTDNYCQLKTFFQCLKYYFFCQKLLLNFKNCTVLAMPKIKAVVDRIDFIKSRGITKGDFFERFTKNIETDETDLDTLITQVIQGIPSNSHNLRKIGLIAIIWKINSV